MQNRFNGQVVLILGAGGGLGQAISRTFLQEGAKLVLAGRHMKEVQKQPWLEGPLVRIETVDITQSSSIQELLERIHSDFGALDIVVNAAGYDVRKSLVDHTDQEIERLLDVDLMGPILVTKAVLPYMKPNRRTSIVHVGGFADGRMAFPYYSVDVASRSGLYSFVESMNRELELEGSQARLVFFCPSPAETEAERPFHPLWEKMEIPIVPTERVASELLKAVEHSKTVSIMGGFTTLLFAKINSAFPGLADVLAMKNYGRMLRAFLYGSTKHSPTETGRGKSNILNKLAVALVVLSFILYGLITVVPFMQFTLAQKAAIIPGLIAGGEFA